ncbi:MAG TPA: DUF1385 domain-containing protein, partial [bacterium]|nr:DUF1385 domain-containing protein [bacterium]
PPPAASMATLTIGGQAVVEGVMMRSPRYVSVATRQPSGALLVATRPAMSLLLVKRWLRLPVLRGIAVLYDAVVLGAGALLVSANAAVEGGAQRPLTGRDVGLTVGIGLGVSLALFFVAPTLLARAAEPYFSSPVLFNLAEGVLRIALVVGYVATIGHVSGLGRVYQYHGAEHKVVNAFERGLSLDVPSARGCSRFHPRCGTSFVLVVLLASVIVFALLGRPPLGVRLAERLLLLPLIAGLSYEIIRGARRWTPLRALVAPGMWLQRLTTREPDDAQIEVAILALRRVVEAEAGATTAVL